MSQADEQGEVARGGQYSHLDRLNRTRWEQHTLRLAYIGWVPFTLFIIGFIGASLPTYISYLHLPRVASALAPDDAGGQLTKEGMRELQTLGLSLNTYIAWLVLCNLLIVVIYLGIGGLIVWRTWRGSRSWMALCASYALVLFPVNTLEIMLRSLPPSWGTLIDFLTFLSDIGLPLFACLFPTGRFLPRWTAWLALASVITWGIYTFVPAASDPSNILALIIFICILLSLGSLLWVQVYRYRRIANQVQRQQAKWVFFGLGSCACGYIVWTGLSALFFSQGMFGHVLVRDLLNITQFCLLLIIPFAIGFAILRYRLWDIDVIIHRTLVYGLLTLSIISLYALIVGTLGTLLQAQGNFFIALLAAGLVAVLFQPLRAFLQRGVNRLLYGQRDEPYQVIAHLSQRLKETLESDAILSTIVETVAQALRLPYAAILWQHEEVVELAASYGSPVGELLTLPLVYQEQTFGQLELAPRSPGESFTPADMHLLDELARQAGLAAHAVRLASDLQKARERLVLAREEERRRLRRDLHDGVGPTLASLAQRIDTARHLVPHDPDAAVILLNNLKVQVRSTIADIRRVVYALRPPVLDELGLVSAISEYVMQLQETNGLHVSVEVPTVVPELSAAVEVAAYRITLEALTNVERHARAQHCILQMKLVDGRCLYLSISDDGRGLPGDYHAGVGITSMRERAAELGGEFTLTTTQGLGTCIQVRLPLK